MQTERQQEISQQALTNALQSQSLMNLPTIYQEFSERGITDIQPRVNVFTYHAWKALGRQVRKGEHGVKVVTFVPMSKEVEDKETGAKKTESFRTPRSTTVFHVSQTDPIAN